MSNSRAEQLSVLPFEQIDDWNQVIRQRFLATAAIAKTVNFRAIAFGDLELLFKLYDVLCFDNLFKRTMAGKVSFSFSPRMTSAGAKVMVFKNGLYRLTVSSHLLYQGFKENAPPVTVNGVVCTDRLAVLQRLVEHEMIHLYEFSLFGNSSCKQKRFKEIALAKFGHPETTHRLVTVRQRALTELNMRIGDKVTFEFDGKQVSGFINRITKRATVLVLHPKGTLRDRQGNRYRRYYVPLRDLTKQA